MLRFRMPAHTHTALPHESKNHTQFCADLGCRSRAQPSNYSKRGIAQGRSSSRLGRIVFGQQQIQTGDITDPVVMVFLKNNIDKIDLSAVVTDKR